MADMQRPDVAASFFYGPIVSYQFRGDTTLEEEWELLKPNGHSERIPEVPFTWEEYRVLSEMER